MIGREMFTSFFATPSPDQIPFSIYELVPIPFNHERKKRIRLAQMPAFIGIESKSLQLIRWSEKEATSCNFELMSSCRETSTIQKDLEDNCLYQILTESSLTVYRTGPYPDPIFVHRAGQHQIVSTNTSTKCHLVTPSESNQHKVIDNNETVLPPLTLITTMDTTSLTYNRFFSHWIAD